MRALIWATLLVFVAVLTIAESDSSGTNNQPVAGTLAIIMKRGKLKNSGHRKIWGGGTRKLANKSGRRISKKRGYIIKCCGRQSCLSSNQHHTGGTKDRSYTKIAGSSHNSSSVPSKDAAAGGNEKIPLPSATAKAAADGADPDGAETPTAAPAAPAGDKAAPTEAAAAGGGDAAATTAAAPADASAAAADGTTASGGADSPAPGGGEPPPTPPPASPAGDSTQTTAAAAPVATSAAAQAEAQTTTSAASGGGAAAPVASTTTAAATSASVAGGNGGGSTTTAAANAASTAAATTASAALATASTSASASTTTTIATTTTTTLKPCTANCPQACAKNASLFTANVLTEPHNYGIWRNKCGKSYLFGTELLSWQDNWAKCCSLGMKPLTIDTKDQQLCLGNTVKGPWFGSWNYWTSGSRAGCPAGSSFTWCSSNTAVPSGVEWDQGKPDNGAQTCVQLMVNPKTGTATLTDRNCSNVYPLACEDTAVRTYDCDSPTCSANCTKDMTLFQTTPELKLNNHATYGSWLEVKGRLYLLSSLPASWQEASTSCCKLGMSLLSLETLTETANLYGKATQRSTYWTSGTDTGCDDIFGWCGSSKTFVDTQVTWAGAPRGAPYHCVTATLGATKITLADETCDKKLPYICEVRSTKMMKPGKAVMDECTQQLGLTTTEINAISATSVSATMPAKTKCYLKCVGEQLGIFDDGGVVETAALSLIDQLFAMDEVKLQDHYDSFETCMVEVDPNGNECETAYLIYKCAMEYADFPNFIAQLDSNTTAEISPLPCAPTCL